MLKHNIPKWLLNLLRPIIKYSFFYLFFVTIFFQQSCTKIDTNVKEKIEQNQISATEFFHSSKPLSVGISQIVEKLKKEDLRSNFVKDLPKDCGLPIWDKLVIQRETNDVRNNASARENNTTSTAGGASSDVIIVPLTITNNSLSSILVATELNDSSWLISTKVVNHYLYYVTHTASVDTSFSKKTLAFFLFMENNTFGTTIFHNIPGNLFPSIHFIDHNGNKNLTILNFDPSQYDSLGTPIMSSRAMAFISHEPPPEGIGHVPLLWGSSWLYQGCSYCPPPGWPTSGGGGGGNPPPNPIGGGGCPWYNPSCNTPPPPPPVPQTPCQVINALVASPDYQNKLNYLKGKGGEDHETALLMINPATDMTYEVISGPSGNQEAVNFNPAVPLDAVLHNHYDAINSPIFSFSDINKMYEIFKDHKIKNTKTFTLGVVTSTTSYLIMFDSTTFKNFGEQNLSNEEDAGALEYSFYKVYKLNSTNDAATNELQFLRFIQTANCGIKLFKGNSDFSSFTPITLNAASTATMNDPDCGVLSYLN